ncbi:4-(cytidine 5'-diphospho)-2-C-methyl-D-erythritol kinase [Oleiphilus sp. HI0125]|uniref:4-(cytidine 5'-diphospho)-2-C-methyl-D-erythritol kinase n=1 Tax=Oleiphilus sp. HI0125 TaxID=1822266 RepID=UPI0007C325CB|nr:4-(cytidine 5'-diphospho)-2-C-methyl-D-erythritol kinase [Oleiphilus sp. HI0125]KZZ59302.1 4-(cytidine 5'-diphospho)-2-C-methyl-D-erythritol kinase [Oleiphilus sp. HI0125]
MVHSLSLPAPAKLNLFLHINGRRPDGYHELQTVFQLLDFGDELYFELNSSQAITIKPEFNDIPVEDNLIYQAAKILEPFATNYKGVDITLNKRLPMGGGVGGGSSDAATTLIALNYLWQCNLSNEELCDLGIQLGADVPVFVNGKTSWAEGIGEQLSPIKTPDCWYVVLAPEAHISTVKIFSNEVLTRDTPKMRIAPALEGQALNALNNDCEALVKQLYPTVNEAINWLSKYGPTKLTGTGACCFCRLSTETEARQVLKEAGAKFKGFIAKGVSLSPAHQKLNEVETFAKDNSK